MDGEGQVWQHGVLILLGMQIKSAGFWPAPCKSTVRSQAAPAKAAGCLDENRIDMAAAFYYPIEN
jgi:hypothetical protein